MKIRKFTAQNDFLDFLYHSAVTKRHFQLQASIMEHRADMTEFMLDGYCAICQRPSVFLVDQQFGAQITEQGWQPNWRERLSCQICHLINRQRALIHFAKLVSASADHPLDLYVMEQITPVFTQLTQLPSLNCVGSEYLDDNLPSGTIKEGIRHENVESLSFKADCFDIVLSNDILEHVNEPLQAMAEVYRILKPGGRFLISIPFFLDRPTTIRRATLNNSEITHHLPPVYHGNPLTIEGSLVFHDFGWDFLTQLQQVGFKEVALHHYWSYFYGYLGEPLFYFNAEK